MTQVILRNKGIVLFYCSFVFVLLESSMAGRRKVLEPEDASLSPATVIH